MTKPDLVVFSHLRWGFVHQRPQHLLSRLASHWRITFIEEPLPTEGLPFVEEVRPQDGVTVLVPHTAVGPAGFHDDQLAILQPMLARRLEQQGTEQPVVWLYTPMALPLADALDPLCVVYDCMDELSAFKDAPRQLRQRESALMKLAALVVTGGPSLYEVRRRLHSNVHCVPSSVDAHHFSATRLDPDSATAREVHALQGHLTQPRLGYFGVIDERMDVPLVAHVADQHPEWQIVMVGPVVKIDPSTLPQRPNIHWLGMQTYERLPHFLAGWDVCLMPFALNEATRFISPTKTLEYMAGDKPVVSTAVNDVISLYGQAVEVAHSPASFTRACARLLAASETAREARSNAMAALVAAGSWERSAEKVHLLLCEARKAARERRLDEHTMPATVAEPVLAMAAARA